MCQQVASGRFLPAADGTHVVVRLSIDRLQAAIGLVVLLAGMAIWWSTRRSSELVLIVIGLILVVGFFLGRWLARAEGQFLLNSLVETLRVEERPLPTQPTPQ